MALEVGSRLDHYDVTALIGEGGMGQVYQATDTKLNRQVALKILPEAFASDPDRLARFQREAQVLASLNHPGIAAIYGLEESGDTRALVLELVEGPTLADRISKGPIPVDEALPVAKQIAEALEAAHEAGVIHRDLKPANIKVKDDGTVKVLDFGLAKALDTSPEGDPSQSPTLTAAATQMGVIMGTAAYMSPEQAAGKLVDRRADIWAFGAVLYETLTGQRLFAGEDVSHTLAHVLTREIEWTTLPNDTSETVRRLLRRSLERDPRKRMRDIGEARQELEAPQSTPMHVGPVISPQLHIWQRPVGIAAVVVASLLVGGAAVWNRPLSEVARTDLVRFVIAPHTASLDMRLFFQDLAISPDGTQIVYKGVNEDGTASQLNLQPIDQFVGAPLRGGEGLGPFFSPNGEWVGFVSFTNRARLQKVSILGGPPVTLTESPSIIFGASWGTDDQIIFGTFDGGLFRVSGGGGEPEGLTTVDAEQGETTHRWPFVIPDREAVVFVISSGLPRTDGQLAVLDLATGDVMQLGLAGVSPRYVSTGHLVYAVEDGSVRAVPFDVASLEVRGSPVPLIEGVAVKGTGAANFSVSNDGRLVYVLGAGGLGQGLAWVDRDGQREDLGAVPLDYRHPRISPDGTRIAVSIAEDSGGRDIQVYDLARGAWTRLTVDPAVEDSLLWAPDGQSVVFRSTRDEGGVYRRAADGTGAAEPLTTGSSMRPFSYARDGTVLIIGQTLPDTRDDLFVLPIGAEQTPTPLLQTGFDEEHAALSPDGRWLAYTSDEGGNEGIYVRPFPNIDDGKFTVSVEAAREPLWGPDGTEIFYVNRLSTLMAVPVETDPTFRAGAPDPLFDLPPPVAGGGVGYDVAPDGQRFLLIVPANNDGSDEQINVVLNWHQELLERVPVD